MDQISTIDERAPLISIIIPTYNRAGLIRETLDSIKAQTSPQWECIVVDDMSSDNTETIVAEYSKADNRFSFYQRDREPKGAPTCRNIGLQHAKGEWVIFLDSDDLLAQNRIQKSLQLISEYPSHELFVFRVKFFGKTGSNTQSEINPLLIRDDLKQFLDGKCSWVTTSPTWKKMWVNKVGDWREGLEKWQDWEFHVRALLYNPRLRKVDEIGYNQRISDNLKRISNKNIDYLFFLSFGLAIINLIDIAIKLKTSKSYINSLYRHFFFCLRQVAICGQTRKAIALLQHSKKINLVPSLLIIWSIFDIAKTSICMRISLKLQYIAKSPFVGFSKCLKS